MPVPTHVVCMVLSGLEVRRDAVELLQSMGITAIRQGGSFADAGVPLILRHLTDLRCLSHGNKQ